MADTTTGNEVVYSWCVEYAKSNRSSCQASKAKIELGAVRLGKEVDNTFKPGAKMFLWYLPQPLFDQFRKGSASKPRIVSIDDVVGFGDLKQSDQDELGALVDEELAFREGLTAAEGDTERYEHFSASLGKTVFWSILVVGPTTRVSWGQVGDDAVLSEKTHADEAAADKFKAKMVSISVQRCCGYCSSQKSRKVMVQITYVVVLFFFPP